MMNLLAVHACLKVMNQTAHRSLSHESAQIFHLMIFRNRILQQAATFQWIRKTQFATIIWTNCIPMSQCPLPLFPFLCTYSFFMPPTSRKLMGHIGFRFCIHPFVRLSRTVHARVLKFHIWIPHGKIADTHFFLVQVISLPGVMPL